MMINISNTFTGYFLIATPKLNGSIFEKTVTYLCEHHEQGAMGIIVNHPLSMDVQGMLTELNITINNRYINQLPLAFGGPVHNQTRLVLHRDGKQWAHTCYPTRDIAVTASTDILEALAKQDQTIDVLMTVGYASWKAGQLETEIRENNWLFCPAEAAIVFDVPAKKRWQTALKSIGLEPNQLLSKGGYC